MVGIILVFQAGLFCRGADAGLTQRYPDLTSQLIQVDYTAATGSFIADGLPTALALDSTPPPTYGLADFSGTLNWNITLLLDTAGSPLSGDLTVVGKVPNAGFMSGTLLTGDVSHFDFVGAEIFEFLFDIDGGDMESLFGGPGGSLGVILDAWDTGFDGDYSQDFSNSGFGSADTFPVPEPGGLVLILAIGGMALFRCTRRR